MFFCVIDVSNNNNGVLSKCFATVSNWLKYSLMKSVGLGQSALIYDPLFTCCMIIGQFCSAIMLGSVGGNSSKCLF